MYSLSLLIKLLHCLSYCFSKIFARTALNVDTIFIIIIIIIIIIIMNVTVVAIPWSFWRKLLMNQLLEDN